METPRDRHAGGGDAGGAARALLDRTQVLTGVVEQAERELLAALVEQFRTGAWQVSGLGSAVQWLSAYTRMTAAQARPLARVAELCHRYPELHTAVQAGVVSVGRALLLAGAVTKVREPWLEGCLEAFIGLSACTDDDRAVGAAIGRWVDLVDQERELSPSPAHELYLAPKLFGGGRIYGELAAATFARVEAAVDAFTQDPDPVDAPYRRSAAERRADGLGDMADYVLSHTDGDAGGVDEDDDFDDDFDLDDKTCVGREILIDEDDDCFEDRAGDPVDDLDIALADPDPDPDVDSDGDVLDRLRARVRADDRRRLRRLRRRVKPRSGVCVNVHIDLDTICGVDTDPFSGAITCRTDRWALARRAAEELGCDAAYVATIFRTDGSVLDANPAAEHFSKAQRRALAARYGGCVFPGCTAPPHRCHAHHCRERSNGGPTIVANGCLLCGFHHRLVHRGWQLHQDQHGRWSVTDRSGHTWTGRAPPQATGAA